MWKAQGRLVHAVIEGRRLGVDEDTVRAIAANRTNAGMSSYLIQFNERVATEPSRSATGAMVPEHLREAVAPYIDKQVGCVFGVNDRNECVVSEIIPVP